MANVKNYGISGIGSDVQFGLSGGRLVYKNTNGMSITEPDGVTLGTMRGAPGTELDEFVILTQLNDAIVPPNRVLNEVAAATQFEIADLSSTAPNMVDGVFVSLGDRVLVYNQGLPGDLVKAQENGIYVVIAIGTGANGVWQRAPDNNTNEKILYGDTTFVVGGATDAGKTMILSNFYSLPAVLYSPELGAEPIVYKINSQSATYGVAASGGLSLDGSNFQLDIDTLLAATPTLSSTFAFGDGTAPVVPDKKTTASVFFSTFKVPNSLPTYVGPGGETIIRTGPNSYGVSIGTGGIYVPGPAGKEGITIDNDSVPAAPTLGLDIDLIPDMVPGTDVLQTTDQFIVGTGAGTSVNQSVTLQQILDDSGLVAIPSLPLGTTPGYLEIAPPVLAGDPNIITAIDFATDPGVTISRSGTIDTWGLSLYSIPSLSGDVLDTHTISLGVSASTQFKVTVDKFIEDAGIVGLPVLPVGGDSGYLEIIPPTVPGDPNTYIINRFSSDQGLYIDTTTAVDVDTWGLDIDSLPGHASATGNENLVLGTGSRTQTKITIDKLLDDRGVVYDGSGTPSDPGIVIRLDDGVLSTANIIVDNSLLKGISIIDTIGDAGGQDTATWGLDIFSIDSGATTIDGTESIILGRTDLLPNEIVSVSKIFNDLGVIYGDQPGFGARGKIIRKSDTNAVGGNDILGVSIDTVNTTDSEGINLAIDVDAGTFEWGLDIVNLSDYRNDLNDNALIEEYLLIGTVDNVQGEVYNERIIVKDFLSQLDVPNIPPLPVSGEPAFLEIIAPTVGGDPNTYDSVLMISDDTFVFDGASVVRGTRISDGAEVVKFGLDINGLLPIEGPTENVGLDDVLVIGTSPVAPSASTPTNRKSKVIDFFVDTGVVHIPSGDFDGPSSVIVRTPDLIDGGTGDRTQQFGYATFESTPGISLDVVGSTITWGLELTTVPAMAEIISPIIDVLLMGDDDGAGNRTNKVVTFVQLKHDLDLVSIPSATAAGLLAGPFAPGVSSDPDVYVPVDLLATFPSKGGIVINNSDGTDGSGNVANPVFGIDIKSVTAIGGLSGLDTLLINDDNDGGSSDINKSVTLDQIKAYSIAGIQYDEISSDNSKVIVIDNGVSSGLVDIIIDGTVTGEWSSSGLSIPSLTSDRILFTGPSGAITTDSKILYDTATGTLQVTGDIVGAQVTVSDLVDTSLTGDASGNLVTSTPPGDGTGVYSASPVVFNRDVEIGTTDVFESGKLIDDGVDFAYNSTTKTLSVQNLDILNPVPNNQILENNSKVIVIDDNVSLGKVEFIIDGGGAIITVDASGMVISGVGDLTVGGDITSTSIETDSIGKVVPGLEVWAGNQVIATPAGSADEGGIFDGSLSGDSTGNPPVPVSGVPGTGTGLHADYTASPIVYNRDSESTESDQNYYRGKLVDDGATFSYNAQVGQKLLSVPNIKVSGTVMLDVDPEEILFGDPSGAAGASNIVSDASLKYNPTTKTLIVNELLTMVINNTENTFGITDTNDQTIVPFVIHSQSPTGYSRPNPVIISTHEKATFGTFGDGAIGSYPGKDLYILSNADLILSGTNTVIIESNTSTTATFSSGINDNRYLTIVSNEDDAPVISTNILDQDITLTVGAANAITIGTPADAINYAAELENATGTSRDSALINKLFLENSIVDGLDGVKQTVSGSFAYSDLAGSITVFQLTRALDDLGGTLNGLPAGSTITSVKATVPTSSDFVGMTTIECVVGSTAGMSGNEYMDADQNDLDTAGTYIEEKLTNGNGHVYVSVEYTGTAPTAGTVSILVEYRTPNLDNEYPDMPVISFVP